MIRRGCNLLDPIMSSLPYLPLLLTGLITGAISFFFYDRTKKTGFVPMGIGFILLAIPNLVYIVLGGSNLVPILIERGLTVTETGIYVGMLGLMNIAFQVLFAGLVLAGLVLLGRAYSRLAT